MTNEEMKTVYEKIESIRDELKLEIINLTEYLRQNIQSNSLIEKNTENIAKLIKEQTEIEGRIKVHLAEAGTMEEIKESKFNKTTTIVAIVLSTLVALVALITIFR